MSSCCFVDRKLTQLDSLLTNVFLIFFSIYLFQSVPLFLLLWSLLSLASFRCEKSYDFYLPLTLSGAKQKLNWVFTTCQKTFDPEVNFVVNSITLKHLKNWFECDYQSSNLYTIWGDNGKSWETWKKHTLISVLFFAFLFLYFSFPFIHFAYFFFISSVLHKFCVCWTIIDFC